LPSARQRVAPREGVCSAQGTRDQAAGARDRRGPPGPPGVRLSPSPPSPVRRILRSSPGGRQAGSPGSPRSRRPARLQRTRRPEEARRVAPPKSKFISSPRAEAGVRPLTTRGTRRTQSGGTARASPTSSETILLFRRAPSPEEHRLHVGSSARSVTPVSPRRDALTRRIVLRISPVSSTITSEGGNHSRQGGLMNCAWRRA